MYHCARCTLHASTSRHDEADFCEKFNEFGDLMKGVFPNIEVIANYEKPKSLECFDVYIRGRPFF